MLVIFSCLFYTNGMNAQCAFGGANSGVVVNPTAAAQLTPSIQAGSYFTMNIVNGGNYTISTCGLAGWDTQLTVRSTTGTFVAYNDDACGLQSQTSFTATFTGQVRVRLNQYNCATTGNTSQVQYSGSVPTPIITIDDVSVDEDAGNASFIARHTSNSASGAFTVGYTTIDNSANAGTDYTSTSGTLNFNGTVNDTETITVPITNDGIFENIENFTVQFTSSSDPSIDITDTALGNILDDDAVIMTDGVTENTCSDVFLDSGGVSDYSSNQDIVYTICPDGGGDYIGLDFTSFDVEVGDLLYIYDGSSTGATLLGQYDNNNIPDTVFSTEASGCLTFRFTSNGSVTAAGWEANVNCYQSDGPQLIIDDITVDEDVGNAIFTVTSVRERHGFNTFFGFLHRPFTVDFQTVDGSALAGSDYTATSGTLTFDGRIGNVQTISIPISNDGLPESLENFTVEFTGADANFGTVNFADTGTGNINSQILVNDPLTLFQEFDGYYDYSTTGGSLRTTQNGASGDACLITTSSSNQLVSPIPATATIERAYLYWAHSSTVRDDEVTFEGQSVSANFVYQTSITTRNFYGYVSDVTPILKGITDPSTNTFDFTDLNVDTSSTYCSSETVLGGWTLMVFYEDVSLPAVNINLYQGFDGYSNAGTSFTLDSFYAIAGSGAKATFLSWEGDATLDGNSAGSTNPEELSITNQSNTTFVLSGDGGQTGNNAYNSTIYDNTVGPPVYNTATSYGVDLDTYDISTFITPGDSQVTANVDAGQDFLISAAVVLKVPSNLIAGTVFEDVTYGGGTGRNFSSAVGVGVQGAIVELFDASGNFIQRNTTDANGDYSFGGMADGDYSIKVVNATVKSSRAGGSNCSVCYPIQTFRSYNTSGSTIEVTNEVGGANPSATQDVALGVLNNAQSISEVSVVGNGVAGIDFGFNFNTIVNTNEDGQGSLEQFIVNSNTLDETGLDIESNSIFDPATGDDTSIFMIPSTGDPLGRTADTNFTSGYFNITVSNGRPLSTITGANTNVDGRTQTAYSGNTNTGTVGSGGTSVGTSAVILPDFDRPEIQVYRAGGDLIKLAGTDITIRNLSINANNNAGVRIQSGSATISNNLLGVNALGNATGNIDSGIEMTGGAAIIDGNFISDNTDQGIWINGGTSTLIQNNEITVNGNGACNDNIRIQNGSDIVITQNLISNAASFGIEIETGSGGIVISENTITNSGQDGGNCGGSPENAGIFVIGNSSGLTNNIIATSGGAGIVLGGGNTSGNLISQNSIYANGTASPALGIDIDASGTSGDGVTLNDSGDADNGPNGSINFPIITSSYVGGGVLTVRGWVRPGATIEWFLTDINEATATAGDNQLGFSTDYGEGQIYLGTSTEGSVSDLDSTSSAYNDDDGNTDTTNKFHFVVPIPPSVQANDLITSTATIANSTSEFSPFSIVKIPTIITNRRITYRVKKN